MAARRQKRVRVTEPEHENWEGLSEDERATLAREWSQDYYRERYGKTQLRKFLLEWAKKNVPKEDLPALKAGLAMSIYLDGAHARILSRGFTTETYVNYLIDHRIPSIIKYGREQMELNGVPEEEHIAVKKPSIQERITEQVRALVAEIDNEIDVFLSNGCKKPKFDLYKFLQKNDVKGPHTKKIAEHLNPILDEIAEVISGTDEQLVEGYSFLTKAQQGKYRDFVRKMVTDTESWIDVLKAKRKPRTRKIHSVQKQTSQVKYKERDDEYKIASVSPSKLVDATQAWIFDCKNRFLFKYVSTRGLVVKGTTLKDFDKNLSFKKKIRKPEKILPDVLKGGKVKLRKIMDTIAAKETKVTGRINKDMVILRVL